MRRMYSEQELTNTIKAVFEAELADGALDENVADAVDAYLVENPVDITALEGQDISCNSVDADATITGAEIVEKMSGYSMAVTSQSNYDVEKVYFSAVKNGNKLTVVTALNITKRTGASDNYNYGSITIPSAVGAKLYPATLGVYDNIMDNRVIKCLSNLNSGIDSNAWITKNSNTLLRFNINCYNMVVDTKYYVRYEVTFLLSDDLES